MFGLGPAGTLAVLGALLMLIILAAVDARAIPYVAPPVLTAGGVALVRVGGEPLALAALRRARWRYGASRDYNRYRVAVVAEHSPAYQLPGVLAPLALLDAEDGYGGRYAIVLDRRTGLMTPTLRVIPASTWLADRADADGWVSNWGGWLAGLGHLPIVRWVAVTVDTAPDPAPPWPTTSPRRSPPSRRWPPGGSWANSSPPHRRPPPTSTPGSASPSTRRPLRQRPPARPPAAAEVDRMLPGLEYALGTCGVTVLGRASAAEIAGIVRTAFDPGRPRRRDPAARRGPEAGQRQGSRLGRRRAGRRGGDPGPLPARRRHQRHLGLARGAPAAVTHDVLARLLAPGRSSQAGQPAVPAVDRRPGGPRSWIRGQRRPIPRASTGRRPGGTPPPGTAPTRPARPPRPRRKKPPAPEWA